MKTNNKRHNDVPTKLLSKEVNTVVKYNKADMMKFIFKPMNDLDSFRQKCADTNVHKLAPLLEVISEVLSDPYFEYSPNDCGDHHIQSAIDCLQVASRHLIKNATINEEELT